MLVLPSHGHILLSTQHSGTDPHRAALPRLIRELPPNPRTSLSTSPSRRTSGGRGISTRKNHSERLSVHLNAGITAEYCDLPHCPPFILANTSNSRVRETDISRQRTLPESIRRSLLDMRGDFLFQALFRPNTRPSTPREAGRQGKTSGTAAVTPRHLLAQDHSPGVHPSFGAIRTSAIPRSSHMCGLCMLRSRSMGLFIPHVGEPLRSGPVVARGTGIRGPYRMGDICTAGQFWFAVGSRSLPRPSR